MRKGYNPYLLPKWARKVRFYCKTCVIPLIIFQAIRTILIPTTGDIVLLLILCIAGFALFQDWI